MKNYSVLLTVLLLVIGNHMSIAQEKTNQFDAEGKRTGVWKKYYNNNRVRYQGQFVAGKEIGIFKFYSALSSEHPIVIKKYVDGSAAAKVKFYTEKGVLESEGEMISKNRVGKWLYYHKDGKTIMSDENYENGVLNGKATTYYKSGEITEVLNYSNGSLHGNVKRYDSSGTIVSDLNYKKGKLHGMAKYYNADGKLKYSGPYENDEKVGEWVYFEKGKQQNVNKIKQ